MLERNPINLEQFVENPIQVIYRCPSGHQTPRHQKPGEAIIAKEDCEECNLPIIAIDVAVLDTLTFNYYLLRRIIPQRDLTKSINPAILDII